MARARFGRLPRQAPSLTGTIVALAQEYQRVRESNIVDAWKNGGEFEGKQVHDKDVLAWMKARRNELSPGDPKWDYYDNQVAQYEFAIANSKKELEYKRGDASDAEMAQFYHTWAGKLPKDSEAYREREKLAAAYLDRGRSSAASGRRAAQDANYGRTLTKSYRKEFAYDATLTFLTSEAINRGILQDGEDLSNIDPNTADGREINRLWDEIATSPEYADTRRFYAKQIRANGDPGFKGDFSQDAFNSYSRAKSGGVNDRIHAAKVAGRQGDITAFTKEKDSLRYTKVITSGFDETEHYEEARKEWLATFSNPHATPLAIDRANTKYVAELENIKKGLQASLKVGEVDPRLGAVNLELRTMAGDEAPVQHWGGMFGPGDNEGGKDATETALSIKQNLDDIAKLSERDANGQPMYVLTKTMDGVPAATTGQNHAFAPWGVMRREDIDPNAVFVVQSDFNDPRAGQVVTAVSPMPVYLTTDIRDPATGDTEKKQGDTPAAFNYTLPDGKTGFKYMDASGNWKYTPDNPFGTVDPKTGAVTLNAPIVGSKGATVNVPGNGTIVPGANTALLPSYYNPGANAAMTSRVASSGYGMWLIASDSKDSAAYTMKSEDIVKSLELEAGGDMDRLREMVIDADQRRAVYLGTATDEQQRIKRNAALGTPNPVPLSSVMTKLGITQPSEEQKAISELTRNVTPGVLGTALEDERHLSRDHPDVLARKTGMVAPPPPPYAPAAPKPTALGLDIPTALSKTLGDIFAGLTGTTAGRMATAPKPSVVSTTRPVYGGAPQPTAPKPTPPPPPKPPPKTVDDRDAARQKPVKTIVRTPTAPIPTGTRVRTI